MAANGLVEVAADLASAVDVLAFGPPVTHVYNPLRYAWELHCAYLELVGCSTGRVVLLGMNPGPWGMAQTGVPFGEVASVRDWMGLRGRVSQPAESHPKREVQGLGCTRSEVSGRRLWGWARERFGDPEAFFSRFVVMNYCPLSFMEASGRNRTPDKLASEERQPLFLACDRALQRSVELLAPSRVVGIGTFAEKRARAVLGADMTFGRILHPSPASPAANRGWAPAVERQLREMGVALP